MSVFTYNGVTLPYAFATQFTQEAVGDPHGNTDWAYLKFDIKIISYVNTNFLNVLAKDLGTSTSPTDAMKVLRTRLLARREKLSYQFAGRELIPQTPAGHFGTVDARNGPVPQSCTITQLTNTTYIINYHVVAHYWENNKATTNGDKGTDVTNLPGSDVISHRWSERAELNERLFTTKTRQGTWIIRSDNADNLTADQVRKFVANLSLEPGFLRRSSRYIVNPNGLEVDYEIVDVEQFKMPPFGCHRAEGTYTETYGPVPNIGPGIRHGTVHVKLYGSKTDSQDDLYNACMYLVLQKLILNGWEQGSKYTPLMNFRVSGGMWDNYIEMSATALQQGLRSTNVTKSYPFNYVPSPLTIPLPIGGSTTVQRDLGSQGVQRQWAATGRNGEPSAYPLRGTARVFLEAAAYFDPSLNNQQNALNQFNNTTAGLIPGQAGL